MRQRLAAAMTTASLILVVGCSDDPDRNPAASEETTSSAPTETPSPSEDPHAPNVGERALVVGEWREGVGVRSRVVSVTQSHDIVKPSYMRSDDTGDGALAVAEVCVRKGQEAPAPTSYFDFVAYDSNGGQYTPSGSSWGDWPPLPQYPGEAKVQPGRCVTGSILLEVPKGVVLERVALQVDGVEIAEWLTR